MRSHSKDRKLTRVLGVSLLALALSTGLDPDYPFAQDATPRVQVPGDWERKFPVTISPRGDVDRSVSRFSWIWKGEPMDWFVVVLDQRMEVLLTSDHISGTNWSPDASEIANLVAGQRLYWYVASGEGPWQLRSDLQSFALR